MKLGSDEHQQLFAEDLFIYLYVYGTQQAYGMVGVVLERIT